MAHAQNPRRRRRRRCARLRQRSRARAGRAHLEDARAQPGRARRADRRAHPPDRRLPPPRGRRPQDLGEPRALRPGVARRRQREHDVHHVERDQGRGQAAGRRHLRAAHDPDGERVDRHLQPHERGLGQLQLRRQGGRAARDRAPARDRRQRGAPVVPLRRSDRQVDDAGAALGEAGGAGAHRRRHAGRGDGVDARSSCAAWRSSSGSRGRRRRATGRRTAATSTRRSATPTSRCRSGRTSARCARAPRSPRRRATARRPRSCAPRR